MLHVRWTTHALQGLADRGIDRDEADKTLADPERTAPGHGQRVVSMRRYYDQDLDQQMLLCVVTETRGDETAVVTVYKTSRIDRYLGGGQR